MEEQLQLEETQRTNQQSQDSTPHDPSAALRNPEGYTQVPDVFSQISIGDCVDRFISENPGDYWYGDIPSFDDNVNFDDPQISPPVIDFGAVDFFE